MSNKPLRSRIKSVVYCVMAFILTLVLFALSFCITLEATILNPDFILNNMNASNYYIDKRDEIRLSLTDLGYASGLDAEFFNALVDELMISEDTAAYMESYYSGEAELFDATRFKQDINTALDEYIKANNIQGVDEMSRSIFVNKAAVIYRLSLEIPLFSRVSGYILKLRSIVPILIAGLVALALIITAVIFFTNKWKHRAARYLCYAFSGAFLTVGAISAYVLLSGKINHINLSSRALYNLFVQCSNNIFVALLFIALFFLLVAVGLFLVFRKLYKKVSN